jgi:hypothetical protein
MLAEVKDGARCYQPICLQSQVVQIPFLCVLFYTFAVRIEQEILTSDSKWMISKIEFYEKLEYFKILFYALKNC